MLQKCIINWYKIQYGASNAWWYFSNFSVISKPFKYEQASQWNTYLEILQFIILRWKLSLVLNLRVHIPFLDHYR